MSTRDLLDKVNEFRDRTKEQIRLFQWVKDPGPEFIESLRVSRRISGRLDSIIRHLERRLRRQG